MGDSLLMITSQQWIQEEPAMNAFPRFGTVLIERETLLRSSLAKLIQGSERFELLGDFEQVAPAVEGCSRLNPGLVIIDVDFTPEESLDLIELIVRDQPMTRVLALSGSTNLEISFRLAEAKVHGFVAKDEPIEVLEEAMAEVTSGRRYYPASFVRNCEQYRSQPHTPACKFTSSETEILRRVAAGWTSRQIATAMQLSPRSVETYRSRIMKKARVTNAAALVEFALRRGLTKPSLGEVSPSSGTS